jgi:hypothetical protein
LFHGAALKLAHADVGEKNGLPVQQTGKTLLF